MTSSMHALIRFMGRQAVLCLLPWSLSMLVPEKGLAQKSSSDPLPIPLPISMEIGQSLNPWAQNVLLSERYRLAAGTRDLKLQFSNQGPGFWGGRQFEALPGGYQIADLSLVRKWGAWHAFRTLSNIERIVRPESARFLTGAGMEIPKALFGTRLSGYFLHGSPGEQAREARRSSLAGYDGAQFGLTLARALGKSARIQTELARSQYAFRSPVSSSDPRLRQGGRHGVWIRFESTVRKNDLNLTFMNRQEGLANPAMPNSGPGRRGVWLDVRRKLKGHQFQYGGQSDVQRAMPQIGMAIRSVREDTVRWSYCARHLPLISASETWSRQTAGHRPEMESTWRLALDKSVRRLNATFSWSSGRRSDTRLSKPVWDRTVIAGDASIAVTKGQRVHVRYETSGFRQHAISQRLAAKSLQLDTRVNLLKDAVSLSPALELRRQSGNSSMLDVQAARFTLSAQIRMPRCVPGTDLSVYFATNRIQTAGRLVSTRTEFTMRWILKRM